MPTAPWTRPFSPGRRAAASLVAGLGVAATVHLANLLVFFTANGSAAENIVPISDYFLPASLALFVLASVAAALGANRFWYTALAAGLLAGLAAGFAGTVYGNMAAGVPWSADLTVAVVATLAGPNLVFVVASALAALFVGRPLWRLSGRIVPQRPIALVRQPSPRLEEGELTHIDRVPVDQALADAQWEAYVDALETNGFDIVDVDPADELPDSVFVEDVVVVFGGTAVITSPGAESRRAETDAVRTIARKLGLRLRGIELPGTLDGGDVLTVGTTVYVGRGGRTNAEGIRQLREIVSPLGYSVVAIPVKKALHLKSTVTALPDGTIIGYTKLVDNPAVFDRFLAVPEPSGSAVVVLAPDAVLMASSAPKSAALIADLGYRVVTVDVSEFEKLEGCVTCLSVRVR